MTARDRIAAVVQSHRWGVFRCSDGYARTCCRCEWRELADGPTHAEHVADALIAAGVTMPDERTRELCGRAGATRHNRTGMVVQQQMTDDLRTRIAAALLKEDQLRVCKLSDADIRFMADAVITELRPQLAAWARMCVDSGDMTPMAQRLLHNILGQA